MTCHAEFFAYCLAVYRNIVDAPDEATARRISEDVLSQAQQVQA